jgi:hypothetical protein
MAVAETIVFSVLPNSFYSLAIDFVIGKCVSTLHLYFFKMMIYCAKVYANSLLAVLNSRVTLGSNSRDASDSTELSTGFHASVAHDENGGVLS